jgi:hypothetical protein
VRASVGEVWLRGARESDSPGRPASTTGCRCSAHAASWMNLGLTSSGPGAIAEASDKPSAHVGMTEADSVIGHSMHGRTIDREYGNASGHVFVEFARRHWTNSSLITVAG